MASRKRPLFEGAEEALETVEVEDTYDKADNDKGSETETQNKPSKRIKKVVSSEIERIWSEEEEFAILNGAIKISNEKRLDPLFQKTEFHAFTEESQSPIADFSKRDIAMKMRRLKKKFFNNLRKGMSSSNRHESKVYELTGKIWGVNIPVKATTSSNGKDISFLRTVLDENDNGLGESIIQEAIKQLGEDQRAEFVQQWKEIQVLELQLNLKRAELVELETKLMLDSCTSLPQCREVIDLLEVDGFSGLNFPLK